MTKVDYMKPSQVKRVPIKVRTHRTLSTGKVIPTWSMMERLAKKIGQ